MKLRSCGTQVDHRVYGLELACLMQTQPTTVALQTLNLGEPPIERPALLTWQQPTSYAKFACLGNACEDTCCAGLVVPVDAETRARHSQLPAAARARVESLIQIAPAEAGGAPLETVRLREDASCPFLTEKLCGLQAEHGTDFIGDVCYTYPRLVNTALQERSLDLSCPEAARLILLADQPVDFVIETAPVDVRHLRFSRSLPEGSDVVRATILEILLHRSLPLERRLILAGKLVSDVAGSENTKYAVLTFQEAFDSGLLNLYNPPRTFSDAGRVSLATKLLELRMGADYTAPRFRDLIEAAVSCLGLSEPCEPIVIEAHYREANALARQRLANYPHLLENLLSTLAFNSKLPYCAKGDPVSGYLTFVIKYFLAEFLLVATAKARLHHPPSKWAVEAIQVSLKALDRCSKFDEIALDYLGHIGVTNSQEVSSALLVR